MTELPRQIRLAAGDYFMHGQDCRMRQVGLPGNVCCAVIKLGNGFDVERLRRRIAESPLMAWMARANIFRPLPALFPPLWRSAGEPQALLFEHGGASGLADKPESLPAVVAQRKLHAARDPGVAFDVLRHADGSSHLFLSWNHTHLDARGLDLLLNHLNDDSSQNGSAAPNFISARQLGWDLAGWWPNVKQARGSVKWLHESGSEPLFSLLPPGPRPAQCRNNYRVIVFGAEETARIDARCQRLNCGFRRSHFYLAASLRALHNVAVRRGNRDGAYLVPVPHDTRKRGASGPIFSNHLSILFYRLEPKFAGRIGDLLGELSRQMTDQIRDRFPESCMAALEMFKPLPLSYYVHHLGKPTRGKIATLCFSDSGETCAGMKELWGGKIEEVTHLVPSWRPPGLTIIFLRFNQRLSVLLSSVDDCVTPAEVDSLERDVRCALLEEAA
ncbi:MAG: hypothetical protein ABSH48_06370 [Verrucomicrobiota bacterium]|jgi:hypothetical protein